MLGKAILKFWHTIIFATATVAKTNGLNSSTVRNTAIIAAAMLIVTACNNSSVLTAEC